MKINDMFEQHKELIDFDRYEAFFRLLCTEETKNEESYVLRATCDSIIEGLKQSYGGKTNRLMAGFVYDYMCKGRRPHEITFSEFLDFVRELRVGKTLDFGRHIILNLLIFKMFSEG